LPGWIRISNDKSACDSASFGLRVNPLEGSYKPCFGSA
jgi:hypothetical protein